MKVWQLVRGLLFYSTIYWRRASDGLNLPTMSAEERERQRPERNLEIIRPRMRPRAHVDVARGGEVSQPPSLSLPEGAASEPVAYSEPVGTEESHDRSTQRAYMEDGTEQVYVRKRRYRRRLVSRGSAIDRGGFLARVFGKK